MCLKVCTCFMIVYHRSLCIFMYLNVLVHCFSIRCGHFEEQVLFRHKCYLHNVCIHENHILSESCALKQLVTVVLCKCLLVSILFLF